MRNILEYYFSFVHKTDALKLALDDLEEKDAELPPPPSLSSNLLIESHTLTV
jgi:hypothetical protein